MESGFEYLERRQGQIDHGVLTGYGEDGQPALLSESERSVHTYICGVSGSGKSRFLQNLLFQDISKGHPVCLIDPMGDLYRAALDFIAAALDRASDHGFQRRELLQRYLFLDGTDDDNPLRINPLEPYPGETSEQQVDDLMRALERLLGGKLEDQRRLRNVLRAAFMMLNELNRLAPGDRPRLPGLSEEHYPLQLVHAAELLNMPDQHRQVLLGALPDTARMHFHRQYWDFLSLNSQRERNQLVQSSWNVLQYLLADDLVLRVLDTQRSTFQPSDVLGQGHSLFCFLPKNENLAGARFLGKYLTTKLQHAAYRRPEAEWRRPFYLYLDEFHQFVDQPFADAMTNLRKFGLRVTNAHQSQSQPPFDTPEGQSLLRTITANSRVKVLFRLDRPDADRMSQELFALSQRRPNFTAVDVTVGRTEQQSTSVAQSSSQSTGSGHSLMTSLASGSSSGKSSREQSSGSDLGGASSSASSTVRRDQGESRQTSTSTGEQTTESQAHGSSQSATVREVHYTLEGERELLINALQRLGDRQCLLSTAALEARLIETPYVPDSFYAYVVENLPAVLLAMQRERLWEVERMVQMEPVQLLPAASAAPTESTPLFIDVEGIVQSDDAAESGRGDDEKEVIVARPLDKDDPFLD